MAEFDVVVVGAGPAGLSAAHAAAHAGARTLVLERAEHPRYKTCGGGLVGGSLRAVAGRIEIPADDHVRRVTFTRGGRVTFTRGLSGSSLLAMVQREKFDDRLRAAAVAAGAEVRERVTVRALEQEPDLVRARLADGSTVTGRYLVGAEGSSAPSACHVGVDYEQVDLGLELELAVGPQAAARWRGRLLLDWGPIPGSYGWVFPKGDHLTVGVIAARGRGGETREYLRRFVDRLGLGALPVLRDSGHLTRCRAPSSPVRRGRVLLAGDAAGLLEPLTREGISFALLSGALAGAAAAAGDPRRYVGAVEACLVPEMLAGRRLLEVFTRRPGVFHALLATPPGWRMFADFCQGHATFAAALRRLPVRVALRTLR